jgi:class 3 adenylate cyclase/tetratricopeptide (TPR) repeat protein
MRCPKCSYNNSNTSTVCLSCRTPLFVPCRGCGLNNRPDARFCIHCGVLLAPGPITASVVVVPGDIIPRHLTEQIQTLRHTLLGERKQVTVIFADVKGSTEQIQRMDPEEAAGVLDPVLKAMIEAVRRFEGTVNQVEGDGIMALFGAPLAQEDHALRACHAALAMQRTVKALPGSKLEIRVGLHSGEVMVRSIADDSSIHYEALGVTVHLANRAEQLAAPGTIRMTGETYRRAQEFITAEPIGLTSIRGLDRSVEFFELTGIRPVRTRWRARAALGLSKFVGREAEIATLREAFEHVRAGRGEMVAVVGDPGTGKSRLVHEFLQSEASQDVLVVETGAATYSRNSPYLPITSYLRSELGISDQDTHSEISEKVRTRLAALDQSLLTLLPVLHALLDLGVDQEWQQLELLQRQRRIVDAIKTLLLRVASDRPLILVLEDLQWIDAETHAALDELEKVLADARILLVVTYRREYVNRWLAGGRCQAIALEPLADELAHELLRAQLGDGIGLEQVKRLLVERTGGNPLFLEEGVRALIEIGALAGTPGVYRLTKDVHQISVPPTVQAVLAARIDRLPPEARGVLDLASTIGHNAPASLLRAVANLPEQRLHDVLAELQAADFLYETRPSPTQEYAFKHALTRDVAYESMLIGTRHNLHAQIVAKLEQLYEGRLDEQIDNLAEHAFHAGLWPVAVKYLVQACIRAVGRSATRGAVALFEQGLIALAHLPEGEARSKAAIDLRLIVVNALIPLGEHTHIVRHLTDAEALARSLGDRRRLSTVSSALTVALWFAGNHERAMEAGERALATATALGHGPSQIGARFSLGMVQHALGNPARSIEIQRNLLRDLPPEMERWRSGWVGYPSVLIRTFLAGSLVDTGNFAEAEVHLEAGCRIADELRHGYSSAMIYAIVGQLLIERGELVRATEVLERMLAVCKEEEVWAMYPVIAARLVSVYARRGRTDEAIATLEQALQPSVYRRGATYTWLYLYLAAGEAYLTAGRHEDARTYVEQAEALARLNGEQAHLACVLKLRGDLEAALRDDDAPARAERSYGDALALADSRGMRPLAAHCHLGLGKIFARCGRREEATDHLSRAGGLFRELGIARPDLPADAAGQRQSLSQSNRA